MTNKQILETKNKEYGFWGTTLNNYNQNQTQNRWNEAFEILMQLSGKSAEDIREFLDGRSGRHLADYCINNKNVKQVILEQYFKWIDKTLFEDEDKKGFKMSKNKFLFGTMVLNKITNEKDILIYTYKNPNRINKEYAVCIDINENKYTIGLDYIEPQYN